MVIEWVHIMFDLKIAKSLIPAAVSAFIFATTAANANVVSALYQGNALIQTQQDYPGAPLATVAPMRFGFEFDMTKLGQSLSNATLTINQMAIVGDNDVSFHGRYDFSLTGPSVAKSYATSGSYVWTGLDDAAQKLRDTQREYGLFRNFLSEIGFSGLDLFVPNSPMWSEGDLTISFGADMSILSWAANLVLESTNGQAGFQAQSNAAADTMRSFEGAGSPDPGDITGNTGVYYYSAGPGTWQLAVVPLPPGAWMLAAGICLLALLRFGSRWRGRVGRACATCIDARI